VLFFSATRISIFPRPHFSTASRICSACHFSRLWKLVKDGAEAERVNVKLGRSSVNSIEVLDGLKEGDKIILSDMSAYDTADHVHIK
jgi:multidrug efflux pump subunit AcrA (membrane-fusion protein)